MPTITTHADILQEALTRAAKMPNTGGWFERHLNAWHTPKKTEAPIVAFIKAIAQYADAHRERFETGIGDDGFLGPLWLEMIRSTRGLLNGDCGRLDCGTLDHMLCEMARAEGTDDSDL